ncbi:tRNA (adenosine(37)-N6)-threonylcarbamoyltransferase complex ATPase subunit type 1 TsaE [Candidatus Dependentiae bacterium Noda2021]|nr:tRNA (adenosine(37)-N6)-threonylcarbamoyltransferase complex ATPase subunit type 1 TsaE [Candidatus Dependentiae bacterium Noda2021]
MKVLKTFTINQSQISDVVNFLKGLHTHYPIMTFTGPLGAGKTTLIKELLKQCGVQELVTSPTFSIVNSYTNKHDEVFYHFDLYRLKTVDDFISGGFEEYLNQPKSLVCIEWPQVIAPILASMKNRVCSITIDYDGLEKRSIEIKTF